MSRKLIENRKQKRNYVKTSDKIHFISLVNSEEPNESPLKNIRCERATSYVYTCISIIATMWTKMNKTQFVIMCGKRPPFSLNGAHSLSTHTLFFSSTNSSQQPHNNNCYANNEKPQLNGHQTNNIRTKRTKEIMLEIFVQRKLHEHVHTIAPIRYGQWANVE